MNRPTTLEELIAAPPGTPVCDMHDGGYHLADWGYVRRCPVPIEVVTCLMENHHKEGMWDEGSYPLVRSMTNKIAYKVATANGLTTLAYIYDDRGWFLTIEH